MQISKFLNPTTWLVGPFICLQAASAQTITDQLAASKPSSLSPALSTSYLRSAADQDSAYYQSIANLGFELGYTLADESSLLLATGVARDLDALEERNIWSSTTLAYQSYAFEIAQVLNFRYSATLVAPTNSEARDYLSYRGSAGLGANISRTWNGLPLGKSLTLGLSGSGTRNIFKYDATEAGSPNTVIALGTSVSTTLQVNDIIQLSASYGLKKAKKSNGTWMDTRYEQGIAAAVNLTKELAVSVSESNENRAYSYDAQTTQFALYDYQTTIYEVAATYTL